MTIKIKGDLHIRQTTQNIPYNGNTEKVCINPTENENGFYSDPDIMEMMSIENMLEQCDDIDNQIIRYILKNENYIDISEKLYMSPNGIKYRVSRLVRLCNVHTKEELARLLHEYLKVF